MTESLYDTLVLHWVTRQDYDQLSVKCIHQQANTDTVINGPSMMWRGLGYFSTFRRASSVSPTTYLSMPCHSKSQIQFCNRQSYIITVLCRRWKLLITEYKLLLIKINTSKHHIEAIYNIFCTRMKCLTTSSQFCTEIINNSLHWWQ